MNLFTRLANLFTQEQKNPTQGLHTMGLKPRPPAWAKYKAPPPPNRDIPKEDLKESPKASAGPPLIPVSGGRSSVRNEPVQSWNFDGIKILPQPDILQLIPKVRNLCTLDRNFGQVLHDTVMLANTGLFIKFGPDVKPDKAARLTRIINNDSKNWLEGGQGLGSIINKIASQIIIGGAISAEWVPHKVLNRGIDYVTLVNPEDIVFVLDPSTQRYEPYQKVKNELPNDYKLGMLKLNTLTYRYIGFMGDTAIPYGLPILITALKDYIIQEDMIENISFIMKIAGALGYLDVLLSKPGRNKNETDTAYTTRLEAILDKTKERVLAGMKDGVTVGYSEDVKTEFQATTKNVNGLSDLFALNQQLLSNGLKYPYPFMGLSKSTQASMSILFTSLLSKLVNIQNDIIGFLEYGISMHLRLKGEDFDYVKLSFKPSTITDDLKINQGREVRQRVNRLLYEDGIISQHTYADDMGYEAPDKKEPRVQPTEDIGEKAKKKQNREKDKDKSDRKGREKKNPQPTRKDGKAE